MNTPVTFDESLVAPCGINCGSCLAYLRDKNKCYGCRVDFDSKRKTCVQCRIKNCDLLSKTSTGFCYGCEIFPCQRIKHIDKRYMTKYRTSLIQNLLMIKETGITNFLAFESGRRTCPNCGAVLSIHINYCLKCQYEPEEKPS